MQNRSLRALLSLGKMVAVLSRSPLASLCVFWVEQGCANFFTKKGTGIWPTFWRDLVMLVGSLSVEATSTVQSVTSTFALCAGSRWQKFKKSFPQSAQCAGEKWAGEFFDKFKNFGNWLKFHKLYCPIPIIKNIYNVMKVCSCQKTIKAQKAKKKTKP